MLVRVDGAGSTHAFLDWLTGQRLSYSVGFGLPDHTPELLTKIPEQVWTPAYDAHDQVRDGAWVAELTDLLDLTGWPKGMRVIARKERPHPGAQLRLTDIDGLRVTAFATNTTRGQLPDLELRHRRRARAEDRIRNAKVLVRSSTKDDSTTASSATARRPGKFTAEGVGHKQHRRPQHVHRQIQGKAEHRSRSEQPHQRRHRGDPPERHS